ncbi:hypothetical protein DSO57_1034906 [Entomophthora muscae]|uniref:Uncharacterized protein n=1 Tax=Entomophthora muscae TaxID=34485 RepID=A0ACC2TAF2_9FUNG|nr:hypothetical protein DSO57_1034906 [Entomophthora muscae]
MPPKPATKAAPKASEASKGKINSLKAKTTSKKQRANVRAQSALDSQLASLEVIKHAAWKPPQSTSQGKIPPFN